MAKILADNFEIKPRIFLIHLMIKLCLRLPGLRLVCLNYLDGILGLDDMFAIPEVSETNSETEYAEEVSKTLSAAKKQKSLL